MSCEDQNRDMRWEEGARGGDDCDTCVCLLQDIWSERSLAEVSSEIEPTMFYRFCPLNQSLRFTSAGAFSVASVPKPNGGVKHVYKPILTAPPATVAASALSSSASSGHSAHGHDAHGHGHGDHGHHGPNIPKSWEGWENWKSWKDIPDHLVPKHSLRDPDNSIYQKQRYINFRKQQMWARVYGNKPVYLMFGLRDKLLLSFFYLFLALAGCKVFYMYYIEIYKQYYPDSNLFFFF